MKSAYGFRIPEPDMDLTSVGLGTPAGELLRRYWWPVCQSDDLRDLPKRVRLLGEDLVAFRDGSGRSGVLFMRCSHRATSLEFGRVEERGLRCCYHGWLYDVEGRILDMALEPPGSTLKDRLEHPCYPVHEFGGLVFTYMGPPGTQPEFPIYDVLLQNGGRLVAGVGPRLGGPVDCNWLQAQENLMDPLHVTWLHMNHSKHQFPSPHYATMPSDIEYRETELGMMFTMTIPLPDGRRELLFSWESMMPMAVTLFYVEDPEMNLTTDTGYDRSTYVFWCVPVDDTHQIGAWIKWEPPLDEKKKSPIDREKLSPLGRGDVSYEYRQRFPDDKEAVEGLGSIAIHGLEHLATSDRGVVALRKMLRTAIKEVQEGRDPKGVIRDPSKARCIKTYAGGLIRKKVPVAVT